MNIVELLEVIRNGENSKTEFKRDDVHPDDLAKEMSALLNFEGGYILLGVEDSGTISGLTRGRQSTEEWLMNVCDNNIQPSVAPSWSTVPVDEKHVGIVELPADSPGKPHKAKRGRAWVTFVRRGSTSREASREEEGRLYQEAQLMRFDIMPVMDTSLESLDRRRLENYLRVVLSRDAPSRNDIEAWQRILVNIDILAERGGQTLSTAAGLLLFGDNPNRRMPQAGITAASFPGTEKDYLTIDEELIRGPLVSELSSSRRSAVEKGVIDRAVDFVVRNMGGVSWLEGGRRRRKRSYPLAAIRESIVNAVAHRDYTLAGTDIEVSMYEDRLEVISPGRLPNGVTVEKMSEGLRSARNELLKEILRDYGYVEHFGLGVRRRIIGGMREHNGTAPDLIEDENRFTVRLWKNPQPT